MKQVLGLITCVTEPPKNLFTLGQRIAWARKKRGGRAGLSQKALAKKVGVSQSAIGNFEAGIRGKPRELSALADALQVSLRWLERNQGPWEAPGATIAAPAPEITLAQALSALDQSAQHASPLTRAELQKAFELYLTDPRRYRKLLDDIAELLSGDDPSELRTG